MNQMLLVLRQRRQEPHQGAIVMLFPLESCASLLANHGHQLPAIF